MSPRDPSWYYCTNGSTTVGPVSLVHLQQLIGTGTVAAHHSVRHSTWDRWYPVREAAAQLGIAPPGAQPAAPPPVAYEAAAPPGFGAAPPPGYGAPQQGYGPQGYGQQPMQGWAPAPAPALTPTGAVTAALRVASWAIDAAVLAVVALLLNAILPSVPATFLLFCAFVAYTVVLPMKGFATVGHIAIGLRVVRTDGEGPVDWLALGTRAAGLLILAAPCLVGLVVSAVSMFAHDSARAWHDVATGTNLVRARPWDFGRQPVQAAASATPPTAPAATTVEGAPS